MPTPWSYPTVVTQFCEADVHIPWHKTDEDFNKMNLIQTQRDLLHISNPLVNDIKMKTYYLVMTGFEWDDIPLTISGIEAEIHVRRVGRITDETVKLFHGAAIGDNRATISLPDNKIYGADTDLWGLETIPTEIVTDNNFGIIIRYQSHPSIPHKSTPNMMHVQLRLW